MASKNEMLFHKSPPPHFRGLEPDLPVVIHRRRLPHWQQAGATYFVTFRLADSLPSEALKEVESLRGTLTDSDTDGFNQLRALEEEWLDAGHGACLLRNSEYRKVVSRALRFFHGERYWLSAFVLMPNHVHLTVKPGAGHELGEILGSWKSFTARQLGGGNVWQEESYDQIVRDTRHLYRVVRYMRNNPEKAELQSDEFACWVCEEWQNAEWGFDDCM
jgi:REP element-mobilizing transposase RayT